MDIYSAVGMREQIRTQALGRAAMALAQFIPMVQDGRLSEEEVAKSIAEVATWPEEVPPV